MGGENGMAAAIDEPEDIVVRDLLSETNAARAEDATLVVERNARAELDVLGFFTLFSRKREFGRPYSTLNSWRRHSPA